MMKYFSTFEGKIGEINPSPALQSQVSLSHFHINSFPDLDKVTTVSA